MQPQPRGPALPGSLALLEVGVGGFELLGDIKDSPHLRHIPVVVLTTSKAEEDIVKTYDLGVNSFITTPVTFTARVDAFNVFNQDNYGIPVANMSSPSFGLNNTNFGRRIIQLGGKFTF